MKNLYALAFCLCLAFAAKAQLNTDSTSKATPKASADQMRQTAVSRHLHPQFPNLANPGTGYEIDGHVTSREAIINRHVTNIYQLIQ
jgi:hypothetical protein